MTADEIVMAIRDELRAGGRPAAKYMELNASRHLPHERAAAITTAIMLSQEDRILRLEEKMAGAGL